ncbi:MAG: acyl-CoA dehydrogenase family protein [Steroidobacteraceae bacterium]
MKSIYGAALDRYRDRVRTFLQTHAQARLHEFEHKGVDLRFWREAASAGVLGTIVPHDYGGQGLDPLAAVILSEELGRWPGGASLGGSMSSDLSTTLLIEHGTEAQKRAWLPGIAAGDVMLAMCLTEPDAGSDAAAITASAVRDGNDFVVNGVKDPVMNGDKATLLYVIAKTDPAARARGMSLLLVPADTAGITRTRIATMGYAAGDCAAIQFTDVRIPATQLVGAEGGALTLFQHTLRLDRMQMAARSLGAAETAYALTLEHCRSRPMFGQRLIDLQHTQFVLADIETQLAVSRSFLNDLVQKYQRGELRDEDCMMAKIWLPELEGRVLDACVQLWGNRGWKDEHPIARMYTAARAQRIQAGATELMKALLARRYLGR